MALIMPCLLGFNVSIKSQITHQKVICAFSSCGDNRSFCILGVGGPHGLHGPLGQGKGLTVRLFYPVLPGPARPRDTVGISQLQFRIFPSCLIQFHIQDTSWFYLMIYLPANRGRHLTKQRPGMLRGVLLLDSVKLHGGQINRHIGELIKLAGLNANGPSEFCIPPPCNFRRLMDMTMERELWLIFL